MNGFKERGLDEDAFSEKGKTIVAAFDAFRMAPTSPHPLPSHTIPFNPTLQTSLTRHSQVQTPIHNPHDHRREMDGRHAFRVFPPHID
jgi:hypothetical protein